MLIEHVCKFCWNTPKMFPKSKTADKDLWNRMSIKTIYPKPFFSRTFPLKHERSLWYKTKRGVFSHTISVTELQMFFTTTCLLCDISYISISFLLYISHSKKWRNRKKVLLINIKIILGYVYMRIQKQAFFFVLNKIWKNTNLSAFWLMISHNISDRQA